MKQTNTVNKIVIQGDQLGNHIGTTQGIGDLQMTRIGFSIEDPLIINLHPDTHNKTQPKMISCNRKFREIQSNLKRRD